MDDIVGALSTPWVGTATGVIGVLCAIIFFVRSKRKAAISSDISEFTVVGGNHAKFPNRIEILYEGRKVDRVTSSRVTLWNSGNPTIDGDQVVQNDCLRIEVEDGEILAAAVDRSTRVVIGSTVSPVRDDGKAVNVIFDYLDPKDGFSLDTIHSGPRGSLSCLGTIREIPNGINAYSKGNDAFSQAVLYFIHFIPHKIALSTILVISLASSLFALFAPFISYRLNQLNGNFRYFDDPIWPVFIGGALYALLPAFVLWMGRPKYPLILRQDDKSAES